MKLTNISQKVAGRRFRQPRELNNRESDTNRLPDSLMGAIRPTPAHILVLIVREHSQKQRWQ